MNWSWIEFKDYAEKRAAEYAGRARSGVDHIGQADPRVIIDLLGWAGSLFKDAALAAVWADVAADMAGWQEYIEAGPGKAADVNHWQRWNATPIACFRESLTKRLISRIPSTPSSRSTSVLSNLADDNLTTALASVLDRLQWVKDEVGVDA